MTGPAAWRPTAAMARGVTTSAALCALAITLRRPDLLVIVTPVVVATVAGLLSRPEAALSTRQQLGRQLLREGEATRCHITVDDPAGASETVAAVLRPDRWIDLDPAHGQVATARGPATGGVSLDVVVRPTRWGHRSMPHALVVATSPWGAFRWVAPIGAGTHQLRVVPGADGGVRATVSSVEAPGLVGAHRSPRPGTGSEFATIRPFQPGDRLHRIRWPETLRTGTMQVASTWADHDRHIALIVDAVVDVGRSSGIDGAASSLDIGVRAAAAIADRHLGRGDRVSLVMVGSRRRHRILPGTGAGHLRRILEALMMTEPAGVLLGPDRIPQQFGRGSMIVIVSPLRSPWALTRAIELRNHGMFVVVVDCLPPDIETRPGVDPAEAAAWRIERLRRQHHFRRALELGVAVVPWTDAASLDVLIRDLYRRHHLRGGWSA